MNTTTKVLEPKNRLICPSCGSPITSFAGVTPGHSQVVRKGQIFICAHCSNASIVGDTNLDNLSQEKFNALPNHVKRAISTVVSTLRDTSVKSN